MVYTQTPSVDTEGVIREMEDAVCALGLPYVCSNQEYSGRSGRSTCGMPTRSRLPTTRIS